MTIQKLADDRAMIAKIAQQDQTALAQLYDRYARILYAVAFRILGSAEEAEEVILDVFAQVWRTAQQYDQKRGRVDAWLFLMTRSRSLDRLRRLQRTTRAMTASVEATVTQPPVVANDPVEAALISERREHVLAALQQLPTEQRQVLELAYYQGLSHSEIAVQTGQALGTIKTRIRLGLSKLRGVLDAID
jgi:RNA polymerase sigma-70 factor (ECF subfamily)